MACLVAMLLLFLHQQFLQSVTVAARRVPVTELFRIRLGVVRSLQAGERFLYWCWTRSFREADQDRLSRRTVVDVDSWYATSS